MEQIAIVGITGTIGEKGGARVVKGDIKVFLECMTGDEGTPQTQDNIIGEKGDRGVPPNKAETEGQGDEVTRTLMFLMTLQIRIGEEIPPKEKDRAQGGAAIRETETAIIKGGDILRKDLIAPKGDPIDGGAADKMIDTEGMGEVEVDTEEVSTIQSRQAAGREADPETEPGEITGKPKL